MFSIFTQSQDNSIITLQKNKGRLTKAFLSEANEILKDTSQYKLPVHDSSKQEKLKKQLEKERSQSKDYRNQIKSLQGKVIDHIIDQEHEQITNRMGKVRTLNPSQQENKKLIEELKQEKLINKAHKDEIMKLKKELLEQEFKELVNQWKKDRKAWKTDPSKPILSMDEMIQHPAYRKIIEMGNTAVPLILRELSVNYDHWFSALSEITGVNPIKKEHYGIIAKMADDWIGWGKSEGYL